jgi:cobalt transporter subunit CbtB
MQQSTAARSVSSGIAVPQSSSATLQAVMGMLLGVFVVGMAGFSHLDAVHNASHDTRHSNAFPCH